MTEDELLTTALHDKHVALEAKMGDEAGWEMPLSYGGALEEAAEVRRRAGIFDVSHSGRIRIRGDGALELLERACTADVARQEDNTTRPTLLCNEQGGILDLCRLIRLENFWVLVTSPLCRQKILQHLQALAEECNAKVDDQTFKTTMLNVCGPEAPPILEAVLPFSVSDLAEGAVKFGSLMVARYIAERVNFGGQWAVAVAIPNMVASQAWRFITQKAGSHAIAPAGMVAADVLRIEAGLHRYGHELNETLDPTTAGLQELVDFDHDFLGAEAVRRSSQKPPQRRLVGLVGTDSENPTSPASIPTAGSVVYDPEGHELGVVTSGTFSPSLDRPIALAYVSTPYDAEAASAVSVAIADRRWAAAIRPLPFVSH